MICWKRSVGLVFALNVVLGNVCLMAPLPAAAADPSWDRSVAPIAVAAPDAPDLLRSDAEMPVSPLHQDCPWAEAMEDRFGPPGPSPCDSGRCMTPTEPPVPCLNAALQLLHAPALPAAIVLDPSPSADADTASVQPSDGTSRLSPLRSVVLTL